MIWKKIKSGNLYILQLVNEPFLLKWKPIELDADDGYLKLVFNLASQYPAASNQQSIYDYLVLCQIMRDMGEYYRARGCGVETKTASDGTSTIVIYIKKEIWKSLKLS
jgi:hypothetical protein